MKKLRLAIFTDTWDNIETSIRKFFEDFEIKKEDIVKMETHHQNDDWEAPDHIISITILYES